MNKVNHLFKSSLLFLLNLLLISCGRDKNKQPNYLILLADDLGYGDLHCYGNDTIVTPNLDRLATNGVMLSSYYATAPVCSPSRAGLLTGRIPSRTGIYEWISYKSPVHLKSSEVTIATHLKKYGYQTALFGKWHLNGMFNSPEQPQPDDHGFDYWFATQNNAYPTHKDPKNFVLNGNAEGVIKGYSCQIVAGKTLDWLKNNRDEKKPFFVFAAFHEPHEPVESPDSIIKRYYSNIKDKDKAEYFANVTNLDFAVGRLMDYLESSGLIENTMVFFSSDHGPETLDRYPSASRSYGSPGILRGMKLHLTEGGIRVPGIFRYDGVFEKGTKNDAVVSGLDLFSLVCRLSDVDMPQVKLDGEDVLPILAGEKQNRDNPVFWHYYSAPGYQVAMRDGNFKILGILGKTPEKPGYAFDVAEMEMIKNNRIVDYTMFNIEENPSEADSLQLEINGRLSSKLDSIFQDVVGEGEIW